MIIYIGVLLVQFHTTPKFWSFTSCTRITELVTSQYPFFHCSNKSVLWLLSKVFSTLTWPPVELLCNGTRGLIRNESQNAQYSLVTALNVKTSCHSGFFEYSFNSSIRLKAGSSFCTFRTHSSPNGYGFDGEETVVLYVTGNIRWYFCSVLQQQLQVSRHNICITMQSSLTVAYYKIVYL